MIAAVYTQPDRPAGRGRKLHPSPVKEQALAHGIRVCQPHSLKRDPGARAELRHWGADLMVVVAYGLMLPVSVLETPRLGCVNVHASLLPRWRGAAPIQRAVLAGDAVTGVSIMGMEAGLDTGPIYLRRDLRIDPGETGGSLHDKLASLGAQALIEALPGIADGSLVPQPQDWPWRPMPTSWTRRRPRSTGPSRPWPSNARYGPSTPGRWPRRASRARPCESGPPGRWTVRAPVPPRVRWWRRTRPASRSPPVPGHS